MFPSSRHFALIIVVATALGHAASAQEQQYPLEPVDRSSPRATLNGFIDACNEVYEVIQQEEHGIKKTPEYEHLEDRLLRCLDLSQQPDYLRDYVGKEAAICLKEVFDRIELPPDVEIPDTDAVRTEPEATPLDRWTIPHTEITIARVAEGTRQGEFLFSPETVDRAVTYYERVKHLPYRSDHHEPTEGFYDFFLSEPSSPTLATLVHKLPNWTKSRVFGQTIWQWFALLTTIVISVLLMVFVYILGRRYAERTRESSVLRYSLTLVFPIAAMFVPWFVGEVIEDQLAISGSTLIMTRFAVDLAFLLALLVAVVGSGSRLAEITIAHPRIQPQGLDAQFIRVVCRVLSIAAAIIILLEGGRHLGIPLATLVASAGVTGLAVALAAQDSLKGLFSSMTILLDKPYRSGDRIIVGDLDGFVEDIGLRSTRIRLLTGHVASIPNEEMVNSHIENVGRRQHIRRMTDLHIPLDTPREKVEKAVAVIRDVLDDHEGMDPDYPPRVYFNDFNPDSFNIKIAYWYQPPGIWDFSALSQRVNLAILRAFEEQGIQFSLPFRITHTDLESKPGPLELKMVADSESDPEEQTVPPTDGGP